MALPTPITISGLMLRIDGTPEKGRIVFTSPVSVLSSEDESVVVPSYKIATLDEDGAFTITLPATDDPDWTPEGWAYNVSVQLSNRYSFKTVIPYDASGGTIDFSELLPALQGGLELYAAYNHTHAGGGGGPVEWDDIEDKPTTFPPSAHTHDDRYFTESEVTSALSGKANTSHTHVISDTTNLQTSLDGKAASTHTHAQADVTGLTASLAGKAATSHTHAQSDVTGLSTALSGLSGDIDSLDDRVVSLEDATPTVLRHNGSAYVEAPTARIYVGPSDPGSVPDGSVWIDTDA